jgi:hypothetical protein
MGVGVSNWRRTWEKCLVVSVDEIISISIPGTPQWRTPLQNDKHLFNYVLNFFIHILQLYSLST